ncbi:MAG TPA: hypothetical protein VF121_12850 [Thermoanaerobaculia bacterium]|nr:hypothetical protein [Thermoanaerobaculia bacterium]
MQPIQEKEHRTALDRLVPAPRLVEIDRLDLAAPPAAVWRRVRHGSLAPSPLIRALFAIRTRGRGETALHLDQLVSSPEKPGFQMLVEEPPRELAVGAIGRVWESEIPFVHVANAAEFAAFDRAGFAKVAWSIRLSPRGGGTHLELELRVGTTDEASWRKFRRYFVVIGAGSRFIRRLLLRAIARDLGVPESADEDRPLPGDELLPDASDQLTHAVDVAAAPEEVWPWLVQMGCGRAGYSGDPLSGLRFGPTLVEPVSFAMDRRMLIGIKERAEQTARKGDLS